MHKHARQESYVTCSFNYQNEMTFQCRTQTVTAEVAIVEMMQDGTVVDTDQ